MIIDKSSGSNCKTSFVGIQNRNRGASEPSTSSTYCLSDVDSSVKLGKVQ